MSISLDEVRHVARLARLELGEPEILSLQAELNALLGHFSELQDVDVTGVAPASHAVGIRNAWAEDEIAPTLPKDLALRGSQLTKAGLFVVPMIIEE
jgi:aspartyl-tRNA(Asn)/glutamyl-tRNA(Gln) amidotransferase subunit C